MKNLTILLVTLVLALTLAACGTPTETGILFATADPSVGLFVPYVEAAAVAPDSIAIELEEIEKPQVNCVIAGNIGAGGEAIYHTPDGIYYSRVKIDLTRSNADGVFEQWFCSESDAEAAGFRRSSR